MSSIKNIVLTGFMMAGKTVIGREIAKLLEFDFADTDEMIEKAEGRKIPQIFEEDGEEAFRSIETKIAKKAAELKNTVISTGGGMVIKSENIDTLRTTGVIVNLKLTPEIIELRLKTSQEGRPVISGMNLSGVIEKFRSREEFYKNCDYVFEIKKDLSPRDHAEEIIKLLKRNGAI